MNAQFADYLAPHPVIAILRGLDTHATLRAAEAAWSAGVRTMEVPVQTPASLSALRALAKEFDGRHCRIGAGTVVTTEHVAQAKDSGAEFTVAPGLDLEVVEASTAAGLPHLPGVATPSEVQQAAKLGLTWMKAFPATALGTDWFNAMKGPFPWVRFVATGGIGADNAQSYLDAGAVGLGIGSAINDPRQAERFSRIGID